MANHKEQKWQNITIQRGQLITGRVKLHEITGLSERTIRTCINRLKSTNELTIKTTSKFSIITICNYDKYNNSKIPKDQQIDQQIDQQTTSNRPTNDQQPTTNKNDKNDKNDKNEKNVVPPTLEMVKKYCDERGNKIDPQYFIDKNTSLGWVTGKAKTKIVDWQAAIRTWEKYENNNRDNKRGTKSVNQLWDS